MLQFVFYFTFWLSQKRDSFGLKQNQATYRCRVWLRNGW